MINILDVLLLLVPLEIGMVFWIFRWARKLLGQISVTMKKEITGAVASVEGVVQARVSAIINDPLLYDKILNLLLTKKDYKQENGNLISRAPVDFVIDRFLQNFDMWMKAESSAMKRNLKAVSAEISATGDRNERVKMLLKKRVPKEYQEILELLSSETGALSAGERQSSNNPFG